MKAFSVALITMLVVAGAPFAAADEESETKPDCEDGQGWVGYTTTDSLEESFASFFGADTLTPCEGEHWDGQDTVRSDDPNGSDPCLGSDVDPESSWAAYCMASDPNGNTFGVTTPVAFRVSTDSTGDGNAAYTGVYISNVGWASAYQQCNADCSESTTAAYIRDDSVGNVLAAAVSAAGITRGYPSEGDCDQETYQEGAENNNRELCGRDNTAITVEWIQPTLV